MADFPTIDVACPAVPGGLFNANDNVVALGISSVASKVRLATQAANTADLNEVDAKGRNPNGTDPNTFETAAIPYEPKDLRQYARGVEACRVTLQDPDARTALRDLSNRLSSLADDRVAAIKEAKEKAAQKAAERKAAEDAKKAAEAQKKAEDAAKKAQPKTPRPAIDPVPRRPQPAVDPVALHPKS